MLMQEYPGPCPLTVYGAYTKTDVILSDHPITGGGALQAYGC
jgi:hypothetical protein